MTKLRLPPLADGFPLVGSMFHAGRDALGFLSRTAREKGDLVRVRFGPVEYYLLFHPTDIEYVLRGNHHNFIKDRGTRMLSAVLGQGLVTSSGELWRRDRQLIQPAFQRDQIEKYAAVMVAYTQRLLEEWRPGQTRDVHAELMRLTLEIVAQTLFSASVSGQAGEVGRAMDTVMRYWAGPAAVFSWWQRLPTPGTFRFRRAMKRLNEILVGAIAQRRTGNSGPEDLLSRLLHARDEEGGGLSDQQLRDELVTLFLAGHETTAVALTFCFYLLAGHPEVEVRLAAELDNVLAGAAPTVGHLPRLRYTEWVVKEAMRLYPPVPSVGREALHDCEIGGYPVPKGTQLSPVQWITHRDARWFDDPLAFRPERWDHDLARRLPRCAYFPFGDGPRVCIGSQFAIMEAVLILATVASRFRLALAPGQTLALLPSITLRPRAGVRMVIHERRPAAPAGHDPAPPVLVG
jgi:cytochrome P450